MSLVLLGSTSGSVTLQEPAIAGSTVIDLPATSGTMAVSGGTITTLTTTSGISVQGLTVGRGAGAVSTNTAVGASALASGSLSGGTNTGVGYFALNANTTGANNTAVANGAMEANTTGVENSAFGSRALRFNTTGNYNSAFGRDALFSNTTASYNTAVGYQAGYTNTTGTSNVFIGQAAGYSSNVNGAAGNVCVGGASGYSLTTGIQNTFVGSASATTAAGYYVTTGSKNTLLGGYTGNQGGLDIRTASNYIVLSDGDGNPRQVYNDTGGTSLGTAPLNVSGIRGYELGVGGAAYHGNSSRSYTSQNAYWNNSNWIRAVTGYAVQVTYDNSNGTLSTGTAGSGSAGASISFTTGPYLANLGTSWTNSSDERLKDITGEIQNGLEKVCTLRAATFTWKDSENKSPQVGLIAQDVQAVLPEVVVVPDVEFDGTAKTALGVNYDQVIPLLVAAIKELKAEFDAYKEAHP